MRIDPAEWNALDLEAHELLKGIPLHDVSVVDLPGGGDARTLEDLRAALDFSNASGGNPLVNALFAFRRLLGKVFGWDAERPPEAQQPSLVQRVSDDLRARSVRPPGARDGPFLLLYQLEREMLSEARNATVHAFSCMALLERPGGYRFYWGIYVKPVSRFTNLYMAMIEPFRRFIVYPSILKRLRRAWIASARD